MEEEKLHHEAMSGAEYHADALENNERGNFTAALTSTDRAMLSYKLEGNKEFVSMFAVRSLIFRRIAKEQNDDDEFLLASKYESEAGLEIGRRGGYPAQMTIILMNHGKLLLDLGHFDEAAKIFQEALDNFPNCLNKKKSFEADIKANLETAKLLAGDDSAEQRALKAIYEIQQTGDASEHEERVWTASGYMRLARGVFEKNKSKAEEYIAKANDIIEIDPIDLKLLRGDLQKLRSKLQ